MDNILWSGDAFPPTFVQPWRTTIMASYIMMYLEWADLVVFVAVVWVFLIGK